MCGSTQQQNLIIAILIDFISKFEISQIQIKN